MSALIFDSLDYARRLEKAGCPREQAEAHAAILSNVLEERLATKQDIRELELKLTLKMGAMLTAATTILGTLIAIIGLIK